MKKYLLLSLFFLFAFSTALAQTPREVYGTVIDSTGVTLPGVTVKLKSATDSALVSTDINGKFTFKTVKSATFSLTVTGIGYRNAVRQYTLDNGKGPMLLQPITMRTATNLLDEVSVTAPKNPITIKQDTVEYNAASYKVREGSQVEDLLKKLPGVGVDKDGNVEAHGKQITKVRVNGKDYFGGDVQTATQNLPADIVENIQVIDDYGDQANLTGIKTGEPNKILNITIQKNKNRGSFGQAVAGIGTEGRYTGRINANTFVDKRQLSFIGNINNTNGTAFNFGGRGGGGSPVSSANGITTSRSLGFNYRDEWGKKISVYGSYSYSDRSRDASSTVTQQELYEDTQILRNNNSNNKGTSYNHRFDFNMEYKIDSMNYMKITPNFATGGGENINDNRFVNTINDTTITGSQYTRNKTSSPTGGLNVLYNHKFHKTGRNFSINTGFSFDNDESNVDDDYIATRDGITTPLIQEINSKTATKRLFASLSYIEPLAQTLFLEMGYNFNRNNNDNRRMNYRQDNDTKEFRYIDSLSTDYDFQFTTHRFNLNLRSVKEKYNYTIGLAVQPTTLEGQFRSSYFTTNTFNWIPTARFVYNFGRNRSLSLNYNGSNRQPSFSQLQPQPDLSNPQNRIYGNPNLKPEFTNNIGVNYNQFDMASGNSLFANFNVSKTQDRIVSNTRPIVDSAGRIIRETRYLNTDGFYSMNGNYSFSKPFFERKFTVSLNGNVNYNNNISFVQDKRNEAQNLVITQGTRLRIDVDSLMDTEISASYSINSTNYSQPTSLDADARTWQFGLDGRSYFFKNWVLGYNLSQTINKGFSRAVRANPTLLTTYVEYQFMRRNMASIRVQGFDLFNQNTGVSRSVNTNQITDSRTNRLGRYFMLTFSMRLQKFAGRSGGGREGGPGGRRGGGGNFGGGGGGRRGG